MSPPATTSVSKGGWRSIALLREGADHDHDSGWVSLELHPGEALHGLLHQKVTHRLWKVVEEGQQGSPAGSLRGAVVPVTQGWHAQGNGGQPLLVAAHPLG